MSDSDIIKEVRDACDPYVQASSAYHAMTANSIMVDAIRLIRAIREPGACLCGPDVAKAFLRLRLGALEHEVFHVIYLDHKNRVILSEDAFKGTINQVNVYPREIVKRALQVNAASVMLGHNHPSNDTAPSEADQVLTSRMRDGLALVDIRLLDHFIVAIAGAYSFAEHGLL